RCFDRDSGQNNASKQAADPVDHYICPYIALPNSWDAYLQTLSSNTRQKIRRFLRKVEGSARYRITSVEKNSLESHIVILLDLWQSRWLEKKGTGAANMLDAVRRLLRHSFEQNCLALPVLWQDDRPIGAIAHLLDWRKRQLLFYMTARDSDIKQPPPGLILQAYSIRQAIQQGFKTYDFLRGNEPYKYSLGAQDRQIQHLVVRRRAWPERYCQIDRKTLADAFKRAVRQHRQQQLAEAAVAYRQILAVEPLHADALYCLSMLKQQQGENQGAIALLQRFLKAYPHSLRGWLSIGNLYQQQQNFAAAVDAFQQSLALQPDSAIAYNNLGYTRQQQGQWEAAIACYRQALALDPDCAAADVSLANALHAQQKLPPARVISYAVANYELGNRYQAAGDLGTAVTYYQQAVTMNPDLLAAQAKLAQIQQCTS
ncbi:MAG: tetratricopeptide repeat protein, partial [Leptolyngbya sp. SIO4C1]|nr:tetratricopeptide repeat protein [Leptolyngbya sp. SIO4C1]